MSKLPIHERFYTFQGEGVHMGRSAFFIRTFGCPVHCPWCDSAGTWHKDYVPKDIEKMKTSDIVSEAADCKPDFIVITGGEPAVHDLSDLTFEAVKAGIPCHIETSGAFSLRDANLSWITVSPKKYKLPLPEVAWRADELKFIIESPEDIDYWEQWWKGIQEWGQKAPGSDIFGGSPVIWLHPEWSKREDPAVLFSIISAVKNRRDMRYRAGYQMHKLYLADNLDERTRPLAPLGGDPEKGY